MPVKKQREKNPKTKQKKMLSREANPPKPRAEVLPQVTNQIMYSIRIRGTFTATCFPNLCAWGDLKSCTPFIMLFAQNAQLPSVISPAQSCHNSLPPKLRSARLWHQPHVSRPVNCQVWGHGAVAVGDRLATPAGAQEAGYNVPIVRALLDLPGAQSGGGGAGGSPG